MKRIKIVGVRSGMIGDTIMANGMLNYFHKKFENPEITWVIANKFKQSLPLYYGNPLIENLYVCNGSNDNLSEEDKKILGENDIWIDLTPSHPNGDSWYANYTCVEETIRMTYGDWAKVYLGLNSPDELLADFKKVLFPQEQKPRLYKYWQTLKIFNDKVVGIWPCAGYNQGGLKRNPSQEFYQELIHELNDKGYKVAIFGHPNDFILDADYNFKDRSFFEQIQISLEMDLVIGTDSGSGWVIGAYGHPQISLIRDGYPNGRPDFWPLAPENYLDRNKVLTSCGGWDSITVQNVLDLI